MRIINNKKIRAEDIENSINPDDVHEAQRDFIYLRNQRVLHEKVSFRIRMVIWGMVVTGIVSLTIMGFKDFFK